MIKRIIGILAFLLAVFATNLPVAAMSLTVYAGRSQSFVSSILNLSKKKLE